MLGLNIVDGKIPLEEKCSTTTCINGKRKYANGTKEDNCPHCNGTGKVLSANGKAIKEMLEKYPK